ncbi:plasmid recombination protein [Alteromonas macleodii]|uniref:plasmid recombination protein n=1 Tax=Alteromonas macleodii TaxID=28108 RepID=UPI0030D553F2|tara:strand:- start:6406 stop:7116 length:711 start_codon:yes stop_codon:yes gene_type:complete
MNYQFIRLDAYSLNRKGDRPDAIGVLKEARREETHAKHIAGPFKSRQIYGKCLNTVEAEVCQFEYKKINGKFIRKGSRLLMAGVASYPLAFTDTEYNRAQMLRWVIATTKFLKHKFGNNLKAVILHEDEAYPHLHFYCYDTDSNSVRSFHPGNVAELQCKSSCKKAKLSAYKSGLVSFQNDYFREVSSKFDMLRKKDGISVRFNKEAKKAFDKLVYKIKKATTELNRAFSQCRKLE